MKEISSARFSMLPKYIIPLALVADENGALWCWNFDTCQNMRCYTLAMKIEIKTVTEANYYTLWNYDIWQKQKQWNYDTWQSII